MDKEDTDFPFSCDIEMVQGDQLKEKRRQARVNFLAIQVVKLYRKALPNMTYMRSCPLPNTLINSLPTELICEILGYLHPTDLLNLTHIHTSVSALLKDEAFDFVWKSSFSNYPDIPCIPVDIVGLKWADMLFGPLICENCGTSPAIPNITFYRRLCDICNTKEFIDYEQTEAAHLLSKPAQLIAIDPYHEYAECISSRLRSKTELNDIELTLLRLQGTPEDARALEKAFIDYESERHNIISETINKNHEVAYWANSIQTTLFEKARSKITTILKNIKLRFKGIGVDPRDLRDTHWDMEILTKLANIHGVARLTRKRWNKIRPYLEHDVAFATDRRLARERKMLICRRMEFVKEQCRKFAEQWLPSAWAYLPPFYVVQGFDSIYKVIHAPHDRELEEKEVDEVLKHLAEEVNRWHKEKMEQLVSIIPDDEVKEPAADVNCINLATSVFHCFGSSQASLRMGGCLIGWDGAGPHLRCRSLQRCWERRLHFSRRGYEAAISLVRLAGLDPLTTTKWEMDALDRRFVCMNCPLAHTNSRQVYDWTEAVYHGMLTEDNQAHMTFLWRLLGPEAEADIKRREGPDPYIWDTNWICNHCSAHFENRVTRRDVIMHTRERHDISRPVDNLDYVYFAGDRSPRPPALLPVVDAREYVCLWCAPVKRRLYRSKTVRSHIRDAHGIAEPVETNDWKRVDIFSPPGD
ncbi:hypothetical protein JR316_0000203 [Psilocybe cubensis]|uniref:Uncharacterized protein n=2 Tax=Psilocybe cubensis TaxID=181762 RepID=A0ACB8HG43_PSICU|nr:hypothetical protein JR316_0000203 [Psilocybe cubensis]KAH9486139.1 hypothetical protein JR316_0000203 [Psilocybe cubensis]